MLREQAHHRQYEPRGAEPTLQAVRLVKRLLHRVQRLAVAGEAFDRGHLVALGLDREHETRPHGRAVEQHGAASAHAVLASDVSSGQAEVVAEMVGKQATRIAWRG